MTSALVAGLLPEQAHRVKLAVGHRYRLRFVQSNHVKAVHAVPQVTVIVTRYLNHAAVQRLERLGFHSELHYINGRDREVIACLENRPL